MSFNVAAYPSTPYRQTPVGSAVSLFNPPSMRPTNTILSFDWAVYFALYLNLDPNIAVDVDLNSGGSSQGPVIDKIVSVKIDNSNSFVPILIYFPDSKDLVTCPPQTVVTLPCNTNGSNCKVIAQGLSLGNLPQTTVTFYNYFIPPSIDPVVQIVYPQWLGSPTIQRDNLLTPGYGPPALGDQSKQYDLALTNPLVKVNNLFGTPMPSGVIILTQIVVILIGISGGARFTSMRMADGPTLADQLYGFTYYVNAAIPVPGFFQLYASYGKNVRLDATKNWFLENTDSLGGLATGTAAAFMDWSYQP